MIIPKMVDGDGKRAGKIDLTPMKVEIRLFFMRSMLVGTGRSLGRDKWKNQQNNMREEGGRRRKEGGGRREEERRRGKAMHGGKGGRHKGREITSEEIPHMSSCGHAKTSRLALRNPAYSFFILEDEMGSFVDGSS